MKVKITQIGHSAGLIIPKEMLDQLNVQKGDEVSLVKAKNGFMVTPYDPEFEERMTVVRKYMAKYRNALKVLADK